MLGPDIPQKVVVTSFQVPAQIPQAPKWETRQNGPSMVITLKAFDDPARFESADHETHDVAFS